VIDGLVFHHLGVATSSIARATAHYELLGYRPEGGIFMDEGLGIRGLFLISETAPRVELLEDISESRAVVKPFLEKGVHIYHYGYETTDLPSSLSKLNDQGCRTLVPPTKAVGFDSRPVCFVVMKNRFILELIQAAS
jgi:methylmalonyl-CoA/ethylmalonyl-CoA epimerase